MLAQNFKTPAELGLDNDEFEALVKVLGLLERQEISFAKGGSYGSPMPRTDPTLFNMGSYRRDTGCGTAACILGWAEYLGRIEGCRLVKKIKTLGGLRLLFDPTGHYDPDRIKVEHAAIALRNYLTHGEPRWAEALAG